MAVKEVIRFRFGTQPGPSHFPDRCRFNSVHPFRPAVGIESPHREALLILVVPDRQTGGPTNENADFSPAR
jgi:hypothetical protein